MLIGMLEDKDYGSALDVMLPFAAKCCCVAPDSDRALPAAVLAETILSKYTDSGEAQTLKAYDLPEILVFESAEDAVRECLNGDEPVLAFGSLYLAGEVRKAYRKLNASS